MIIATDTSGSRHKANEQKMLFIDLRMIQHTSCINTAMYILDLKMPGILETLWNSEPIED